MVLLVVGLMVAVAANITTWTKDVLLDTDEWVLAVAPLPQQPAVAGAVADLVVAELAANTTNLRADAREALPERARFLAGPIAAALEDLIREQTFQLIQSQKFQALWVEANRVAHEQLAAILSRDESDRLLQTTGGEVRLDLSEAVAAVRDALGADAESLLGPPEEGQGVVVIASADQLSAGQDAADALDAMGIVLPIAAFVLLTSAVAVAIDRRRFLVAVGLGLAVAMSVTLIALDVGRVELVGLIQDQTVKLAGGEAWDVLTDSLYRQTWIILVLALVLAGGAWGAGPSRYAVSARRSVRRFGISARRAAGVGAIVDDDLLGSAVRDHRGPLQIFGAAMALGVLIAWNRPSWVTVVVVGGLLAVWLVALEVLAPRRTDRARH